MCASFVSSATSGDVVANALTTLQTLIRSALSTADPTRPLPTVLEGALARLASLLDLDVDASGAGLDRRLSTFRSLVADVAARETLVIRVLQIHLPRVAEALALVGAITMTWDAGANRPRAFGID